MVSKQVRVSEEIYELIQSDAVPLEDTVDSVLRRWATALGKFDDSNPPAHKKGESEMATPSVPNRKFTGKKLNKLWNVGAKHALYHKDGTWYNNLTAFPGALFDPNGYILFQSREAYLSCKYIDIATETNCQIPISEMPEYKRVR